MKKYWRLWAKALGEKTGATDKEADIIAAIRTVPVIMFIITDILIVVNIFHNWNNACSVVVN